MKMFVFHRGEEGQDGRRIKGIKDGRGRGSDVMTRADPGEFT